MEPMSGIPGNLQSLVEECLYKPAQARPVPQNLLARLQASMQAASAAAARLQDANAVAVQRRAEEERQQSAAQVAAERQLALYGVANQSFERIEALLDRQIMDNAPSVQATDAPLPRTWSLNDATLRVESVSIGPSPNPRMPFEVMAYTVIKVVVPRNRRGYSGRFHSLWYCDAQEPGVFRWYETAFCTRTAFGRDEFEPFDLSPGTRDVVNALVNVMGTVQVARPFAPIDQGEEDGFIERWIEWFATAAQGQLHRPNTMPESQSRGSWRQGR